MTSSRTVPSSPACTVSSLAGAGAYLADEKAEAKEQDDANDVEADGHEHALERPEFA